MVNLGVTLAGVALKNPVIPASGAFGYGREFAEVYDLDILGSFSFKGTTAQARFGNPQPRIAETACGMLNAVGLQNPGIDAVIAEELPNIAKLFHGPVIANIGGNTVEEYAENCRKLDACPQVGIIEVNISCPNVHCGGKNFGSDSKSAAEVTAAVKAATKKPVFLKLSPNVTDIAEIAKACADAGADGLCLINTLLGMRIDLKTKRPLLANRTGGLSGPAVFPVALRMVWDVYEAVKLPIIGCGGISSAEDVCEMMLAGASAVEIGAANLKNPAACKTIIEKLPAVCERLGVTEISQLTGGAHA
ncbi:dihydroorotate dehydrogenase [Oscillibacter ruminantium]|jgi:dihydroorotate dehydrogenase (NAD+) catalytic subunit|uniref:dihydroorotate dehydrogenase n=1 Tax=Oscillibacter ruminantium TaxID=1263547 RepID=UPI0002E3D0A8|nr:dihydroorotate dehydrogenase [Oscillibacter ruminantium]MDN0033127.1 dihydroorotate dehydrogenase [Oscillibacter valericigenes]